MEVNPVNPELQRFWQNLEDAHVSVNIFGKAEVTLHDGTPMPLQDLPNRVDACWAQMMTSRLVDIDLTIQICEKITRLFDEAFRIKSRNCGKRLFSRFRKWSKWQTENLRIEERTRHPTIIPEHELVWRQRKKNKESQNDPLHLALCEILPLRFHFLRLYDLDLFAAFTSKVKLKVETTFWGKYNVCALGGFADIRWSDPSMALDMLPKVLSELWFSCQNKAELVAGVDKQYILAEKTKLYNKAQKIIQNITALFQEADEQMAKRNWFSRKMHAWRSNAWTNREIEFWRNRFAAQLQVTRVTTEQEMKRNVACEPELKEVVVVQGTKKTVCPELSKDLVGRIATFVPIEALPVFSRVCTVWHIATVDCEAWHQWLRPHQELTRCYPLDEHERLPTGRCLLRARHLNVYNNIRGHIKVSYQKPTFTRENLFVRSIYKTLFINKKVVTYRETGPDSVLMIFDPATNQSRLITRIPDQPRRGEPEAAQAMRERQTHFYVDDVDPRLFWTRDNGGIRSLWNSETLQHIFSCQPSVSTKKMSSSAAVCRRCITGIAPNPDRWVDEVWDPIRNQLRGTFTLINAGDISCANESIYLHYDGHNIDIWTLPRAEEDQLPSATIDLAGRTVAKMRIVNNNRIIVVDDVNATHIYDFNGNENLAPFLGYKTFLDEISMNKMVTIRNNHIAVIHLDTDTIRSLILPHAYYHSTFVPIICNDRLILLSEEMEYHYHPLFFRNPFGPGGRQGTKVYDHMWIVDINTNEIIADFETGGCLLPQYDAHTKTLMLQNYSTEFNPGRGKELLTFVDVTTGKMLGTSEIHGRTIPPRRRDRTTDLAYRYPDGLLVDGNRHLVDPPIVHDYGKGNS